VKAFFGPDSPMPHMQDFKDVIAHNKWFFGKGPKPKFDRWTYWEKFDYMAVFWGVAMIGLSGLIMWFPEFFTLWLPGWAINVALIIHSDEALLAAGFIFTFHFFNVHFRPDKFPMDRVMFSGRMSKSELMNERPRLYERWVAEGTLDQHRAGHEWDSWKKIALPAGFMAFMFGVVLMFLIYVAMANRLLGE
jgi:cytochrome b subunit of formate dehydrogenase